MEIYNRCKYHNVLSFLILDLDIQRSKAPKLRSASLNFRSGNKTLTTVCASKPLSRRPTTRQNKKLTRNCSRRLSQILTCPRKRSSTRRKKFRKTTLRSGRLFSWSETPRSSSSAASQSQPKKSTRSSATNSFRLAA